MEGNIETWQTLVGAVEILALIYGGYRLARFLQKEPEIPSGLELQCDEEVNYLRNNATVIKGPELYQSMKPRGAE